MDRVAIFIDGSNFYHALKGAFGKAQIKFDVLAEKLVNSRPGRRLLRIHYYNAAYDQMTDSQGYRKQQEFFNALKRTPYLTLKLGRLERRAFDWSTLDSNRRKDVERLFGQPLPEYTHVEKGVDVQLAVDMVELAVDNTYDVAILISGDGDFAPAVELVKKLGKHVELGRVKNWPCDRLRDACDIEILMDDEMFADCWVQV